MYRFLETIRILDGIPQNLEFHQDRVKKTFKEFFPGSPIPLLDAAIQVPPPFLSGLSKCRIIYGSTIETVEFHPYVRPTIRSLQVVKADHVDYSFKYADRTMIEHLFQLRGKADDILMVKNGRLTDTSYANILLFDGNQWFTPDEPLLNGTCRQRLIRNGIVREATITIQDLPSFQKIMLVNAMLDFDENRTIPVENVFR